MPAVTLHLPTPLRPHADGQSDIQADAATVDALFDTLQDDYPELVQCIRTRDGALRPYVNVFVRRTDIRQLDGLATALADGDEVVVMPSVAGG
jgi:adenylyltransferase/sulfurtransferase